MNIFENIDLLEEREPETPSHKVLIQSNVDIWTVSNMLFSLFLSQNKDKMFSEIISNEGLKFPTNIDDLDFPIGDLTLTHNRLEKPTRTNTCFFHSSFSLSLSLKDKRCISFHIRACSFLRQEWYWFDFDILKYVSFEDKV
jgi:hypothetical protein